MFTVLRNSLQKFFENKWFQHVILILIFVNSVSLGLEAVPSVAQQWDFVLRFADMVIVSIFAIELIIKIWVYRFAFFRSGWNVFDFLVIAVTVTPFLGNISVLLALRILRTLRVLSMIPKFKLVIKGFFDALVGLISVAGVLTILLYVAAVLATKLFGREFPDYFGSLQHSLFSMFQIMTLEGWPDIVRSVMKQYPYAWMFFIPFIMITTFTVFNLLIGVIVNTMQKIHEDELQDEKDAIREVAQKEHRQLVNELQNIKQEILSLKTLFVASANSDKNS